MNQDIPFNPLNIPDLKFPASAPQAAQAGPKITRRNTTPCTVRRRTSCSGSTRRTLDPKQSALRFARKATRQAKTSWKRIKGGIQARLARLDPEKLRRVLVACGIAATVALLIIALSKLTPLVVALLAVLGLGLLLQMWERLRIIRIPV